MQYFVNGYSIVINSLILSRQYHNCIANLWYSDLV